MVDRPAPEAAHVGAAVVHRVRQHQPVVDADEVARVPAQLVPPAPDQLEEGAQVGQPVAAVGRPVAHLDVDVEVVVARPRRHLIFLDPRPLQGRRDPARRGESGELVHAVVVEERERRVGQREPRHVRPVGRPPAPAVRPQHRRAAPGRRVEQPRRRGDRRRVVVAVDDRDPEVRAGPPVAEAERRIGGPALDPPGQPLAVERAGRVEPDRRQVLADVLPGGDAPDGGGRDSGGQVQVEDRGVHREVERDLVGRAVVAGEPDDRLAGSQAQRADRQAQPRREDEFEPAERQAARPPRLAGRRFAPPEQPPQPGLVPPREEIADRGVGHPLGPGQPAPVVPEVGAVEGEPQDVALAPDHGPEGAVALKHAGVRAREREVPVVGPVHSPPPINDHAGRAAAPGVAGADAACTAARHGPRARTTRYAP